MDGKAFVNINGKSVGVYFSINSVQEMARIRGNETTTTNTITIVWGGILGYAFFTQKEPPLYGKLEVSWQDVNEWYDDLILSGDPTGEIEKVMQAFDSSKVFQQKVKPELEKKLAEGDDAKKKKTKISAA